MTQNSTTCVSRVHHYVTRLSIALVVALLLLLGGCAQKSGPQPGGVDALEQRLHAYIKARDAYDLTATYSFLDPEYREEVPLQRYIQRHNIRYKDTSVRRIDYVPGEGEASVELVTTRKAFGYELKHGKQSQQWVLKDGVWYIHVPPVEERFTPLDLKESKPKQMP